MYHYVYRITNLVESKHYYGVRSSIIEPKLDIGFKYFSSSTDHKFMETQKTFPDQFKYKVVFRCKSRKEAMRLEIKIHSFFNVSINEAFYNKCKATSTGFSMYGVAQTEDTKLKISKANKGKPKPCKNKGKTLTDEHKAKLREAKKDGFTDEHKAKLREAKKGFIPWNKGLKGMHGGKQDRVTCPHCGKIGGKTGMTRWHFENCKLRES